MADWVLNGSPMLSAYKWIAAMLIAALTLTTGYTSLRFIRRHQHFLQLGDALADGIFLGTALFHLLPESLDAFLKLFQAPIAISFALLGAIVGFLILFILEHTLLKQHTHTFPTYRVNAGLLVGILSLHAFIAGLAVGITHSTETLVALTLAILAHKGFESFALMVGLQRNHVHEKLNRSILQLFTCITPAGILLANLIETAVKTNLTNTLSALLNAFAAGSFLYIGTLHAGHEHFHPDKDPNKRYQKALATLSGVTAMGVLTLWF